MAIRAKYKYIQDPLYGMVYLSDLEMRIVDSQAFQRLLNVRQLGYAFAVFPGADYSRFSHCIGACQVMGKWLESLEKSGSPVDPALGVLYRLAALLHDVGHYPFSHATERAAKNYYAGLRERDANTATTGAASSAKQPLFLNHELAGAEIIAHDPQIRDAVFDAGISTDALRAVFKRHALDSMASLLSSDVDVDRVDFLRRSAHHSGLPYGTVDSQYLLTQLRLDENDRVCWTEKALSAIDHLLIARYFDYQQIVHNKTVVALEQVLELLVQEMLSQGLLNFSVTEIQKHLRRGTWINIDDHHMFARIRRLRGYTKDATVHDLCDSLLLRNPPRNLFHRACVSGYERAPEFERFVVAATLKVHEIADELGIDRRLWFIWDNIFKFTKYNGGSQVDYSDPDTIRELYEVPYIMKGSGPSIPVIEEPLSLTRLFYTKRRFDFRVYLLFPEMLNRTEVNRTRVKRREIEARVCKALNLIWDAELGDVKRGDDLFPDDPDEGPEQRLL